MSELKETLKRFQGYILNEDLAVAKDVAETAELTTHQRLNIYRNAYYLRLLDILAWDFFALKLALGDEKFDRLGRAYIDKYPSQNPSIIIFGRHFCQFLEKNGKSILPAHLELARFEAVLENIRASASSFTFPLEKLRLVAPEHWEDLQFELNPTIQCFEACWKAPQNWEALTNNLEPEWLEHPNEPEPWLIWGGKQDAWFLVLNETKKIFFEGLKANKTFGEVCEALCDVLPEEEVGQFAGILVSEWIENQILINF